MKVKMNGGMSLKISSLLFRAKGVSKILMQQNWIHVVRHTGHNEHNEGQRTLRCGQSTQIAIGSVGRFFFDLVVCHVMAGLIVLINI